MTTTPMFTPGIDTKVLMEMLREKKTGDQASYEEMSELVAHNVQGSARAALMSARRCLEKEGIVFGVIKNVGLIRLDDAGVVKVAETDVTSIRRKAHRGFNRVSQGVQNYAALSPESKMKFNANASILGMLSTALRPPKLKRIEERVKTESGVLPLAKTLEAFRD